MADVLIDNQAAPSTPAAGKTVIWVDNGSGALVATNSAGRHLGSLSRNDATASQGAGFSADTYVTNSGLLIPSFGMKAGQLYRWFISLSKTAASTAIVTYAVRIGAAQTTADTARLSLTTTIAQTAAVSQGLLVITVGVRSVSATGVIAGGVGVAANSPGLGGGIDGASATFDNTALAGQFVGISINAGLAAAWTLTHVSAELIG